jgi:hypothetical protein
MDEDFRERAIYFAQKVIFFAESLNSETITKMHDSVWKRNVEAADEAKKFLVGQSVWKPRALQEVSRV